MQQSVISRAIEALVSDFGGDSAEAVATVVRTFKAAQAANKGQNASLFEGFLSLAATVETQDDIDVIRAAGARIRRDVTRAMRVAEGLQPDKAKGEKGGPDYSTASVYAGIVADALNLRAQDPQEWRLAMAYVDEQREEPEAVHASGLFSRKNALQAAIKRFHEQRQQRIGERFPDLANVVSDGPENDPAILRTALYAAQREASELRNLLAERDATIASMRGEEVAVRPALQH